MDVHSTAAAESDFLDAEAATALLSFEAQLAWTRERFHEKIDRKKRPFLHMILVLLRPLLHG